jgi:uncharacterized protein DUF6516
MRLKQYLSHIQNILYSRREITLELLRAREVVPDREGIVEGRLRFWDGSLLEFTETLIERGVVLIKTDYAYHFQDTQNQLIFRYDNAPHHPEVSTHPHHKHTSKGIETANPPYLNDVLREIDQYLYQR